MTPEQHFAMWVLDLYPDDDRESERPTNPVLPPPGRVPVFPLDVPEVRYDLEHATAPALRSRGFPVDGCARVYEGLTDADLASEALCDARCALIEAGSRLGRGW